MKTPRYESRTLHVCQSQLADSPQQHETLNRRDLIVPLNALPQNVARPFQPMGSKKEWDYEKSGWVCEIASLIEMEIRYDAFASCPRFAMELNSMGASSCVAAVGEMVSGVGLHLHIFAVQ